MPQGHLRGSNGARGANKWGHVVNNSNRRPRSIKAAIAASAAISSLLYCGPAHAQDKAESSPLVSDGLGDIIVTATRRESRVQDTPLAITALDANALQNNHITDLTRLPLQVPSLFVGGNDGFGSTSVSIRGIGSLALGMGADEAVGVYVDGIYQGKPYGNVFEFVDIDRVEVLRGPQGTLYGRNATGGAINIVTKQPGNEFAGQVNAEYTSYDGVRVSGYVLAPLVKDRLGIKIAAGSSTRDGWAYNPTIGKHIYGFNNKYLAGSLRWTPTDTTDVVLSGRLGKSYADGQVKDANNRSLPIDIFPANYPGYQHNKYAGGNLTINQDAGWATLVSITGYQWGRANNARDSDLIAENRIELNSYAKSRQFTQEVRLVSKNDGPFSWIVGGLYYHENSDVFLPFKRFVNPNGNPGGTLFNAHLEVDSYSGFVEGSYKLTDRLSVTAGARYNDEGKHWRGCVAGFALTATATPALCNGAATVGDRRTWHSLTPRFVINYQASRDLLMYASATRGFRSGGWNFTDRTSFHSGFNPEDIWSYEGGLKSELLDRHLRLNVAGFYADYKNLQVRINDGAFLATRNAGAARIYGVEVEGNLRVLGGLEFSTSGSYLNAKYTEFNTIAAGAPLSFKGQRLNRAPEWNVTVSGQYAIALSGIGFLTPRAEYHYTSETFYSQENIQPQGADPYHELNLRLKFEPENRKWNLVAYVDNLTNNQFRAHTFPGNFPGQVAALYSTPRIYGVRAQFNW